MILTPDHWKMRLENKTEEDKAISILDSLEGYRGSFKKYTNDQISIINLLYALKEMHTTGKTGL